MEYQEKKQMQQDAMRYRWLRSTQNHDLRETQTAGCIDLLFVHRGDYSATSPSPEELDFHIDRAMSKYRLQYIGRNPVLDVYGDVAIEGEIDEPLI